MPLDMLPPAVPVAAQPDAVIAQPNIRPLNAGDIQAPRDSKKFDQTLQDYEAVFLSQMVSHMYEGVPVDPNFGGGIGEETMRSLLINEYGKKMAAAGGIGLAAQMKKQLLQAQEQAAEPKSLQPLQNAASATPANTAIAAMSESDAK